MYELHVQTEFAAAHAISIAGAVEPTHGHNWKVRVTLAGDQLDADGLVCDFHLVQSHLEQIVEPMRNRHLNETPPFDEVNPTAEHVARHIGLSLSQSLVESLPTSVRVASVLVTEAPGCAAVFYAPMKKGSILQSPAARIEQ